MPYNLGYVDTSYNLGYVGGYTGGTNYPYILTSHGQANANSIMAKANFASTDPIDIRIISDFDPAKVVFNWQTFSDQQLWRNDVNTLDAVTVNSSVNTTDTATIGWKKPDGTEGEFTVTLDIQETTVTVVGSPPVITLPYTTKTIVVGDTWTNPTASASDVEDGDLSNSVTVTGSVDPNTAGTYTLTYEVTDSDTNTTTETITVDVVAGAEGVLDVSNIETSSTGFTATYTYSGVDAVAIEYSVNGKTWQTATGGTITYTGLPQGRLYKFKTRINKSGLITYVDDIKLFTLKSGATPLSLTKENVNKISDVVEDLSTGSVGKAIKGSIFDV